MIRSTLFLALPVALFACGQEAHMRVPQNHRVSGSTCPAARGPGFICTAEDADDADAAAANACSVDTDCNAGTNGRCFSPDGPGPGECSPTWCSYDECTSDSTCPAGQYCDCRGSSSSYFPNVCVGGGNCIVDSDCGPGGYCSPGAYAGYCDQPVYFCHAPQDTCIDDSDCSPSSSTTVLQVCLYDAQLHHFACGDACITPP
jgi:hypothetical protein